MLLSTSTLWAVACAVNAVSSLSVRVPGDQEALGRTKSSLPLTVAVQSEACVARPAEIASLMVSVRASGLSNEAANQEVAYAAKRVEDLLKETTGAAKSPIDKWTALPVRIRSPSENSDRGLDFGYDSVKAKNGKDEEFHATAQYSIQFSDPAAVAKFAGNITSSGQVKIDWVHWELTKSTLADAKAELRRKAISNVMEAGKDYAHAFGKNVAIPVEFEEEFSYTRREPTRRYYGSMYWGDDDDANLEPPNVENGGTVKCKFSVE